MSPEEVVRAHLEASASCDADEAVAYFAEDATFFPGFGYPTYSGVRDIRGAMEGFFKEITVCDIEILNLAVVGNVVLTERVDHLIWNGQQHDAPGMGTFEVKGDKITAHRDYFGSGDGPATYGGTTTRAV